VGNAICAKRHKRGTLSSSQDGPMELNNNICTHEDWGGSSLLGTISNKKDPLRWPLQGAQRLNPMQRAHIFAIRLRVKLDTAQITWDLIYEDNRKHKHQANNSPGVSFVYTFLTSLLWSSHIEFYTFLKWLNFHRCITLLDINFPRPKNHYRIRSRNPRSTDLQNWQEHLVFGHVGI
jgi:hypothetical protein